MSEKIITRDTYLKALALFTMANNHYTEALKYEADLSDLLGYDETYLGHISDASTDPRPNFDKALAAEGFIVQESGDE